VPPLLAHESADRLIGGELVSGIGDLLLQLELELQPCGNLSITVAGERGGGGEREGRADTPTDRGRLLARR